MYGNLSDGARLSGFGETLPSDLLEAFETSGPHGFTRKLGLALKKVEQRRFGDLQYRLVRQKKKVPRSGAAIWICKRF